MWARITRGITAGGAVWAAVEVLDRFKAVTLPEGTPGLLVFALLWLALFLAIELTIADRHLAELRSKEPARTDFTPEEAFAHGVVLYASKLNDAQARRDTAVLEIRSLATRPLHLMGAVDARVELGRIALTAASNLDDRLTQASILVDELGWTLNLQGHRDEAAKNLKSAVSLLDSLKQSSVGDTEAMEWRAKALRHIANIESERATDLDLARSAFLPAREAALLLPEPIRTSYLAQVDHSEGVVILQSLSAQLGDDGKVDPQGPTRTALDQALVLAETSLAGFEQLHDKERAVKAAHLKVGLLRHDNDPAALTITRQRLERAKLEASRVAYLP